MKKVLAIIPARSGSKGIPNKNILPLNGHPLLAYSIAAGLQTPQISRVICSTDSKEIAKVAEKYGAEVPFLRPPHLAQDNSRDIGAFLHALQWLRDNESYTPDFVVNLRPTSPIRFIDDIENAIKLIEASSSIDSVRTVCQPSTPPYKMWIKNTSNLMTPLLELDDDPEPYNSARQDLPEVWAQNGAIEVIRSEIILRHESMSGSVIAGLEMEENKYSDIDTLDDFKKAEVMMSLLSCVSPSN